MSNLNDIAGVAVVPPVGKDMNHQSLQILGAMLLYVEIGRGMASVLWERHNIVLKMI